MTPEIRAAIDRIQQICAKVALPLQEHLRLMADLTAIERELSRERKTAKRP